MGTKNAKTVCNGIEWGLYLTLIEKLKRTDNNKFLMLIGIGGYCGLRLGDMLTLQWKDILHQNELHIKEGKTGKHRKVTINPALTDIIRICHASCNKSASFSPEQYIFSNKQGKPLSRQYINRQLHQVFKSNKIKVQNGSSHTLRKTFGRRVYEMNDKSESSLVLLSSIFNHSSTSITRKYIGLTDEIIQDVYNNL